MTEATPSNPAETAEYIPFEEFRNGLPFGRFHVIVNPTLVRPFVMQRISVAVQIAAAHGCRVVGMAGSDEKLDLVRKLGAAVGVNYRQPGFEERLAGAAPDGLDVVRRIESQAALLLRPGGVLIIEHADLQGESLPSLLAAAHDGQARPNWIDIVDHPDLAGRPRFTTARRAGSS